MDLRTLWWEMTLKIPIFFVFQSFTIHFVTKVAVCLTHLFGSIAIIEKKVQYQTDYIIRSDLMTKQILLFVSVIYKMNTNCQLFHGIDLKMWQVDNFPQEHHFVLILEDIGAKYRLSTGNDDPVQGPTLKLLPHPWITWGTLWCRCNTISGGRVNINVHI